MNLSLTLPVEVWRVLHAIAMEDPVPRRLVVQAIGAFEAVLQASQANPAAAPQGEPAPDQPITPLAETDPPPPPPPGQIPAKRFRKGKRLG